MTQYHVNSHWTVLSWKAYHRTQAAKKGQLILQILGMFNALCAAASNAGNWSTRYSGKAMGRRLTVGNRQNVFVKMSLKWSKSLRKQGKVRSLREGNDGDSYNNPIRGGRARKGYFDSRSK